MMRCLPPFAANFLIGESDFYRRIRRFRAGIGLKIYCLMARENNRLLFGKLKNFRMSKIESGRKNPKSRLVLEWL